MNDKYAYKQQILSQFTYRNHECYIARNFYFNILLGYVSVDNSNDFDLGDDRITCYGGISYVDGLDHLGISNEDVIGFDCGHTVNLVRPGRYSFGQKSEAFVEDELTSIVDQLEEEGL